MYSKEDIENKKIEKVMNYILEKANKKEQITKEDDTVYYISQILAIMGNHNNYLEILKLLSKTTKEAFVEIGAIKYGDIFDKTYYLIDEETNKIKGLFKFLKVGKVISPIVQDMYNKIDKLNMEDDLITNYFVPYIEKKYSKLFTDGSK